MLGATGGPLDAIFEVHAAEIAMDPRERALLGGVDLFAGLDERALDDVLGAAHRRRVAKGDVVFQQGDLADSFFVLVEGHLKVSQTTAEGQRVVVRFIAPGEMFGCVAVFEQRCYPGTATAVEPARVLGWTQGATRHLMERHGRLAINALGSVGGRLQEIQARLREMSTVRVERRIAFALLRLMEQTGRQVGGGIAIGFPISRQDMAELTGTTLHTVSRTLSAWEDQGIVAGGRQKITVRDADALRAIAADDQAEAAGRAMSGSSG
jgi:CRP/FNR family transcriptional regulator, nitrogen oxide reductase regulator